MSKARLLLASFAATALLASCSLSVQDDAKKDDPKAESGSTAPTGDDGRDPDARDFSDVPVHGVTDDTVKIGGALIDTHRLADEFGVEIGLIPEGAIDALVDAQNDRGGINGRRIELVSRYFLPIGNEESEKICRELTEDEEVFLVVGTFLDDNALCITETHSTPYIAPFGLTQERMDRSNAPFITAEPMVDEALANVMEVLVDENELDGAKVAIYFEGDLDAKWVEANVVDVLGDAGVDIVSTAQLPSSGDQVQADADATRILQRFESDGADTLINLSGTPVLLPAMAKMTNYRPRMVFTNGQVMGEGVFADRGIEDRDAFSDSIALVAGNTSEEVAADPNFERCIADINEFGDLDITTDDVYDKSVKPDSREYGQLPGLCIAWQLTVDVLEAAGDDLSAQALVDGLDGIELDYVLSDASVLTPTRWGAGSLPRIWTYDVDRDGFEPQGEPQPVDSE